MSVAIFYDTNDNVIGCNTKKQTNINTFSVMNISMLGSN